MMKTSVFDMVHRVLGDAKEKIAADKAAASGGVVKTAAPQPESKVASRAGFSDEYLNKLSSACDHLSTSLHLVVDQRSPQEKLAEFAAINQALQKRAFEGGDKPHQTAQANPDSISPMTVTPDASGTATESAGANAIPSEGATTPGESLDAGESGSSTPAHQLPKTVTPNESPNQQDAANALETNLGMMMPEQPEDLLQQGGGELSTGSPPIGSKTAEARALRTIGKLTGQFEQDTREKMAAAKQVRVLLIKAAQAGIPEAVALAMLGIKTAEDAINPATISGSTSPILQTDPGTPSPLSQGAEAGTNTPRQTAPTTGEGGGRELVSSNESAMNASKGQAKSQNKGALSELLTEPSMSAAHDQTLSKSLDNTSSAGVKISAARELLKKYAASSPEAAQKLAALAKLAEDPDMMGAEGPPAEAPPMAGEAPPMAGGAPMADETAVAPSEEALAAVEAGVTPEELAQAEELLASTGGGEEAPVEGEGEAAAAPPPAAPPQAGAEDPEKLQQMNMGPTPGTM